MKSVSFSLKKPENKKQIASLAPVKPSATVIHTISASGDVNPDKEPAKPAELLVIPCIQPINPPTPPNTDSSISDAAKVMPDIPSTPGLYVPKQISDQIADRPSVLLGLKRPAEEGPVDDEEISDVDSDDFAWGMLRGMGWKGDAESEISRIKNSRK